MWPLCMPPSCDFSCSIWPPITLWLYAPLPPPSPTIIFIPHDPSPHSCNLQCTLMWPPIFPWHHFHWHHAPLMCHLVTLLCHHNSLCAIMVPSCDVTPHHAPPWPPYPLMCYHIPLVCQCNTSMCLAFPRCSQTTGMSRPVQTLPPVPCLIWPPSSMDHQKRKKKTKTRGLQWWVCIWTPFSPTMSSPTSQAWHLLGTPCQGWDHPQDTSSSNLLHLHVTNYHRGLTTIVDRWHTVSRSNYACRSLCIVSWQPLISKIVIAFSTSALCHSTDSTLDSTTCQGILHE